MVNLGFRLQDRLSQYDFEHDESISPDEIWAELKRQNELAAGIRGIFPRTVRHPVVAILACMDARIDTSELVGDTRRYYYIVRTAGSALAPAEQEMLELKIHESLVENKPYDQFVAEQLAGDELRPDDQEAIVAHDDGHDAADRPAEDDDAVVFRLAD